MNWPYVTPNVFVLSGFVYGDLINRKEEDNLRLMIDEIIKKFKPMVRPDMYRVSFTPVKEIGASTPGELRVVEIRVAAGDRYELYQDEMHQVSITVKFPFFFSFFSLQ